MVFPNSPRPAGHSPHSHPSVAPRCLLCSSTARPASRRVVSTSTLTAYGACIYSTFRYLWFWSVVTSSMSVLTGAPEHDYGACRRFLGGQSHREDSTGRFGTNKDGAVGDGLHSIPALISGILTVMITTVRYPYRGKSLGRDRVEVLHTFLHTRE